MAESASQLRRQAVVRIAEIAATDSRCRIRPERLDVGLVLTRPDSLAVLVRQALRAAAGDRLLLEEIALLFPVGRGQAVALDDAIHQHGLVEPTPDHARPDGTGQTEDLADVLREILQT